MQKNLFIIGDSISIGYGPYLEKLCEGYINYARKTGFEPEWQAVDDSEMEDNGGDSSLVLKYLKIVKDKIDADILLVNCGLHDIKTYNKTGKKQVSINDYQENLKKVVLLGKNISSNFVWVTTTHFEEERHDELFPGDFRRFEKDNKEYHQKALEVMRKNDIKIIDLRKFTENLKPDENVFSDHVHFTEEVKKKQAEFIMSELRQI